jgi:hypothetical protein
MYSFILSWLLSLTFWFAACRSEHATAGWWVGGFAIAIVAGAMLGAGIAMSLEGFAPRKRADVEKFGLAPLPLSAYTADPVFLLGLTGPNSETVYHAMVRHFDGAVSPFQCQATLDNTVIVETQSLPDERGKLIISALVYIEKSGWMRWILRDFEEKDRRYEFWVPEGSVRLQFAGKD